ncbi:MAG TPA: hypothetical protein H9902_15285 [Candidatus Stackebrandtia faecavium]|nr:hypothetical protein [Candidatus Stackebrandtia faecavium]
MAVYLQYVMVEESSETLRYAIHIGPDDPDPVVVEFRLADDAPPPVATGSGVAANRAIRKILGRKGVEGAWPKGGIIQS